MPRLVLFGPGFAGSRIIAMLNARDEETGLPRRKPEDTPWHVSAFGRHADGAEVRAALADATHIISTVPPTDDHDPILDAYAPDIKRADWIGYLSSTGVYGNTGGAWVDEAAPLAGRRGGRMAADLAWQRLGACVFRLPGIYGPGRSMLDRVRDGRAHKVDLPGQVFSRIHVDDIAGGVVTAIDARATGPFNLADDLPAPQNDLVDHCSRLLGMAVPPSMPVDALDLSPAARAFYRENRRVANGRAGRVLGWRPIYPTYREGLAAILQAERVSFSAPAPVSSANDPRHD